MVKNSYMGPTQYSVVRLHRLPSKFAKFVRCIFLNCCSTIEDRNTNLVFRLEDQRQLERKIYKTRLNRVLKTKKLIVYILPNSFCTPLELPKIGFTPKSRDLSQKTKNGGHFKIDECNMTGRISSIFCIFYLLALKWL